DAVRHELHAVRPERAAGAAARPLHELVDLFEAALVLPPERALDACGEPASLGRAGVDGLVPLGDDRVLPGGDPERMQMDLGDPEALEELGVADGRDQPLDDL